MLDAVDLALHHGAEPATYAAFAATAVPRRRVPLPAAVRNLDPLSS